MHLERALDACSFLGSHKSTEEKWRGWIAIVPLLLQSEIVLINSTKDRPRTSIAAKRKTDFFGVNVMCQSIFAQIDWQ